MDGKHFHLKKKGDKMVKVVVPDHEHNGKRCSGSRQVIETERRVMEFCPECKQGFNIKGNLFTIPEPEVIYTCDGPQCSISLKDLTVDMDDGQIICNNEHCNHLCSQRTEEGETGIVLEDDLQSAFTLGFINPSGIVNLYADKGRRLQIPPLKILLDLGLRGIEVEPVHLVVLGTPVHYDRIFFEEEEVVPKATDIEHVYDIGDEEFYLFHYYGYVTWGVENADHAFERTNYEEHVFTLIDKKSKKIYVRPKETKTYYGFKFSSQEMYVHIPQKGNTLVDGDVFKDNTRFLGYKTKEQYGNPKTRKKETVFDYLVKVQDEEEFRTLMDRPTRIFSSNEWSGVGKYNNKKLYYIKSTHQHHSAAEIMKEESIYNIYLNLIEEFPYWDLKDDVRYFFDFDFESYLKKEFEEEEYDEKLARFKELYEPVYDYLDNYCPNDYGQVSKILYGRYSDAEYGGELDFTKYTDRLKPSEYFDYSNKEIIEAAKYERDMKLVRISSNDMLRLARYLRIGDMGMKSIKRTQAHGVAFDYHKSDYMDTSFSEIMFSKGIPFITREAPKPKSEWSSMDWKIHNKGREVTEVSSIIFGRQVADDDALTLHCLDGTPVDGKAIAVTGSRNLPEDIRTRYLDMESNGYKVKGYYTPAVSIWRGYFRENKIKILYARVAKGSDISAIVAALEHNQELIQALLNQKIDFEEYAAGYIQIVCILHGYYINFDFNNPGLRAILTEVIEAGGYVLSKTPYRKKRGAEYTEVVERSRIEIDRPPMFEFDSKPKPRKKFSWFDTRIMDANELLVSLSPTLVALCRTKYSGTTNTIELAKAANKEVIELTSPDVFIDYKGKNDPIRRGSRDTNDYYFGKRTVVRREETKEEKIERLITKALPMSIVKEERRFTFDLSYLGRNIGAKVTVNHVIIKNLAQDIVQSICGGTVNKNGLRSIHKTFYYRK